VEKLILKHNISERHARSLLRLESEEDRLDILEKVIARDLTVRECEALVDLRVDTYAPTIIEKAQSLSRIEVFLETLKKSVSTLRSLGIDVTDTTTFNGNKMYVTVKFEEI
jgi:ParB family chromosome partitioning protein